MTQLFDLLTGGDLCWLGLLILIFIYVGQAMAPPYSWACYWGWRLAAAAFVAFYIWGYLVYRATDAQTLAGIAFRALFAAGLALGSAWIVLAILAFMFERLIKPVVDAAKRMAAKADEQRRRRQEEEQRRRRDREEEERRRRNQEDYERWARERKPDPTPPTRQELAAAARAQYEATLRMLEAAALDDVERSAARERAKQKYLHELDEVMK